MKYLGVIGHPRMRSLSPAFQQAALDHLRLDVVYEAWPTPEDGLETRLRGTRATSVLGANVTIPHKETVVPLLNELDEVSRKVGAVNTIINREGRLHGSNTDVAGFLRALREDVAFEPAGKRVVIAGAGGAARGVVVALIETGAASISLINRTYSRATRLIQDLRPIADNTKLDAFPEMYASWGAALGSCDLLVNCTSVGSAGSGEEKESPLPVDLIRSTMLVYDVIYRPAETPLMKAARKRGAEVLGGLPMLVYQGAASLEMWTGQPAPVDVMFEAANRALKGKP